MLAFHSDHFTLELPAGHSFPMDKYRLLRERLLALPRPAARPPWRTWCSGR